MQKKTKLTIGPLPEQAEDYSQYEESVVRWDRIILLGVAGILLLGILIYYGFSSKDVSTDQKVTTSDQLESDSLTLSSPPVEPIKNDVDILSMSAERPPINPVVNTVGEKADSQAASAGPVPAKIAPDTIVSKSTASETITSENIVKAVKEVRGVKGRATSDSSDTANALDVVVSQEQVMLKQGLSKSRMAEPNSNQQAAEVLIVNSGISRAVLTTSLEGKIPGEPLGAKVALPTEGIMKVILFTEMKGIRGKTLYHEWYREGVRQARVKIPVNVDPQRSYSSKYINHQMLGKWQVKILDGQSEPYVLTDFEVIAH